MDFKSFKNIDSAFKHVRFFTVIIVAASVAISLYALYSSAKVASKSKEQIYILTNGKALEAFASERKDNIEVEAKDHVRTFHYWFFSLDPDEKVINANITKALYLADGTAKEQYDNLKENNYIQNLISGNISQEITFDSVTIDLNRSPLYFKCYAKQRIIRPSTIVTRSLITEGQLRNVARSDNNPHGFLIEKWRILENNDLHTENR